MFRVFALLAIVLPSASAAVAVKGLLTEPQPDGSVKVSWLAPANAEGRALYEVTYSTDLKVWTVVEDPSFTFAEGRAIWFDTMFSDEQPANERTTRFYRAYETFPNDESLITARFGQTGPIPLGVLYAEILPAFEPSAETVARSQARLQLSLEQDLDYVLGEYIVHFNEDVFTYQLAREGDPADQLVTDDGVALQTLAAELVAARNGELTAVWESTQEGFGAYLPPPAVDALRADPRIESVMGNGIVHVD